MNRAIAASILCLCMAGAARTEEMPDPSAVHGSIWAGYYLSPLTDSSSTGQFLTGQLLTEQPGTEPWMVLSPGLAREEVRQFITGIERMHDQSPQWPAEVDFAPIEWRSLQDPQGTNAAGSARMRDWLALQDATVIAPPVADAYRSTDRWLKDRGGRSSDAQARVDYTNQAEREKGDGRLREIDPPFPTVLWLVGAVLIAMATISRRSRSG